MIQTPTVLALGAGASMPYGFPSGKDLKQQVIDANHGSFVSSLAIRDALKESHRMECKRFCDALKLSAQPSVDAFLEHRPEFMRLGKLLIAYVLISCENTDNLFVKDDWYQFLWQQMGTRVDEFHKNRLSVVTFNYDRSLEHFLHTALMNSYKLTEHGAAEQLKHIPIVHVYGQLGLLKWQLTEDACARPYNQEPAAEIVKIAADGIKILTEGKEDSDEFRRAHRLVVSAERVYFLGFSYQETKMARLKLPLHGTKHYSGSRLLAGTRLGLTEEERIVLRDKYVGLALCKNEYAANEFLHHEESFLRG